MSQNKEFYMEVLQNAPANISAGLSLVKILIDEHNFKHAFNVLTDLWNNTHNPEIGTLLSQVAQKLINDYEIDSKQNDQTVARIVSLVKSALNNKISVDALQYNIIGGLALDALTLIPIFENFKHKLENKLPVFFSGDSANPALVEMISRKLPVFKIDNFPKNIPFSSFDWAEYRYNFNSGFASEMFGKYADLVSDIVEFQPSTCADIYIDDNERNELNNSTDPLLDFNSEENNKGEDFLRNVVKIPDDGWYVCIYTRDAGYYNENEQSSNAFRNADINQMIPAIEEIISRGGYVIRVGSKTISKLNYYHPHVFDYSTSIYIDPLLDIYLIAKARFLIGTPSGYTHVALPFRTPQLLVNAVNCFGGKCDLWIPKKMIDTNTNLPVKFSDFMNRYYSLNDLGAVAENGINQDRLLNVRYVDNTSDEILSATKEMFDRMEKQQDIDSDVENIRNNFKPEWLKWDRPADYLNIASCFIRDNKEYFTI